MNPTISIFHKTTLLLTISIALLLTACQTMPVHHAYQGPHRPDNELATFIFPESFNLLFIDKNKYRSSLSSGDGARVKTLPGQHQFILIFKEYWDLPGDDFERVESNPISIKINAEAGLQYNLEFKKPKNIEEARAFAKNPSIAFINSVTKSQVATTINYNYYTRSFFADIFNQGNANQDNVAPSKPEPEPSDPAPSPSVSSTPAPTAGMITPITPTFAAPKSGSDTSTSKKEDGRALEMLKYWWESASENQKKTFQEWVKQ